MHTYEVRPRKDKRGVDLISDVLPFRRLWYATPDHTIGYAERYSRSHNAVIRVYDAVAATRPRWSFLHAAPFVRSLFAFKCSRVRAHHMNGSVTWFISRECWTRFVCIGQDCFVLIITRIWGPDLMVDVRAIYMSTMRSWLIELTTAVAMKKFLNGVSLPEDD